MGWEGTLAAPELGSKFRARSSDVERSMSNAVCPTPRLWREALEKQ
jgi:hypothetical protein